MRKLLLVVALLIAGSWAMRHDGAAAQERPAPTNAQSDISDNEDVPPLKKPPPRAKAQSKPVAAKPKPPAAPATAAQAAPTPPAPAPVAQAPVAPVAPAAQSTNPPAPAAPPPPAPRDFTSRLKQAGAGTCATQVDAVANPIMAGVIRSNVVSNWAKTAIDKRLVSVAIGQKYPEGSRVPYAVTGIVAAPSSEGACDIVTLQVVPSPLPCDKARENLTLTNQTIIGDLAGVLVMRDSTSAQTMLVPTGANTCVLVGFHATYGTK